MAWLGRKPISPTATTNAFAPLQPTEETVQVNVSENEETKHPSDRATRTGSRSWYDPWASVAPETPQGDPAYVAIMGAAPHYLAGLCEAPAAIPILAQALGHGFFCWDIRVEATNSKARTSSYHAHRQAGLEVCFFRLHRRAQWAWAGADSGRSALPAHMRA